MENASKALLLGGGVLIGLIVISIGVFLFVSYKGNTIGFTQTMEANELKKFNVNFTKFEGRDDITIQEIVTLLNFVEQYEKENKTHIQIAIGDIPDIINYINNIVTQENKKIELIENNVDKIFKCKNQKNQDIKYDKEGKIYYIKFSEKK